MGDRPAKLSEKKRKTNLSEVREHAVAKITLVFFFLALRQFRLVWSKDILKGAEILKANTCIFALT